MAIKIDQLIRSKRKTIQLTISRDARLIVRAPVKLSLKWIQQFVEEKGDWIEKNIAASLALNLSTQKRRFLQGESMYFLGSYYSLSIREDESDITIRANRLLFPEAFMANPEAFLENWYINEARNHIGRRLLLLSHALSVSFKSFKITRARRRWGSCSSKNMLNFSWRLIQAEPRVIDYVIVHELCHVLIKNHSKSFWQMVEQIIPDYRILRKWLRDHQYLMDL